MSKRSIRKRRHRKPKPRLYAYSELELTINGVVYDQVASVSIGEPGGPRCRFVPRARIDAGGTAKPMTKIAAVVPAGSDERSLTHTADMGVEYVVRSTK